MKLLACSVLLLVLLRESYCKTTSTINRTSTSWGYGYEVSDTQGFKVKHDDKGYHFEPTYNNTSSGLKKHYNSRTVYDHFTSPGATNDSQSHNFTNTVNSRPNKDPLTTGRTVTVAETRPVTDKINLFPDGFTNRQLFSFPTIPLYNPPNEPMYGPPTGPMYGPSTGPMYGPPTGPIYGPPTAPNYAPPTDYMYGTQNSKMYRQQNGQMYGPQNGQTYSYPTSSSYGSYRNY